ncbi:hypothetical protein LMG7974_01247 [Campylobacter majalis]|uniref:Outer membrane porin, OprD family n=1 Tax=Campylobacter majalis TaxID=2790656 RepID=A0ABM8Q7I7_9BACT|nr:OprD family outer membrane porin [Campylobacter majalis]CAD7288936.1 hypothetical protein LMG7974_01247 [Campylobacter majalis]
MKLTKLSLIAAVALTTSSFGADTLAEAFTNGKLSTTLKATYTDYTDERAKSYNENIFGMGLEIGYVTDPFYGFRLGLTAQAWGSISPEDNARVVSSREWYANGFSLSEAYLGYTIGGTDIKVGRQYVVSPVVAGNYTRAFKEAFEGVSIKNTDIADTELFAGWFYKFQGRTNNAMGSKEQGRAPTFKDRVILGGMGNLTLQFDNIYTASVTNKSIDNLKLTAAYGRVDGVQRDGAVKDSDVDLYFAEASYTQPFDALKFGFDFNYKGSRADGALKSENWDGNMFGFRVRMSDFYGFSASYAYTTMSDNNALIFGAGNGPASYTIIPIFGPFQWTGRAGMDTHKLMFGYDFGAIGVKGLSANLHLVKAEQDAPNKAAGATKANEHMDVKGYSVGLGYKADSLVKGLAFNAVYTEVERENFKSGVLQNSPRTQEFWLQASYKFNLLN